MTVEIAQDATSKLKPSRSIQEFRLDFFLEEEFSVDPIFIREFVVACQWDIRPIETERILLQLAGPFCRPDVVVLFSGARPDGKLVRAALLIEDKITASPQPKQANNYRKRGDAGIKNGDWDCFLSVLVAPASYISVLGNGYDRTLSLEHIKTWVALVDPERRAFKLRMLDEAIAKKNSIGIQIIDPDMTRFRAAYHHFATEFNVQHGTGFLMPPPRDSWFDDSWFNFKSSSLPEWAAFRHMARTGNIEIDFKNFDLARAASLQPILKEGMTLEQFGKRGVAIRILTPAISAFDDFEHEQSNVNSALLNAKTLAEWYRENHSHIEPILSAARTR